MKAPFQNAPRDRIELRDLDPGEAAILALGRIVDRPWAVDGGLAVRPIMQLSLYFDHRVVDGAAGSTFLSDVASYLQAPPL